MDVVICGAEWMQMLILLTCMGPSTQASTDLLFEATGTYRYIAIKTEYRLLPAMSFLGHLDFESAKECQ